MYIEITNVCNLRCSFCIQNQREARDMRVEEFLHIIKQVQPFTKHVYLHVLGEPLSHPFLKEILAICADYFVFVNLTTNGTLLKEKQEILCQASALRQVNVSLHSFAQHRQHAYIQTIVQVGDELARKKVHVNYRLWNLQNGKLTMQTKEVCDILESMYGYRMEKTIQRMTRFDIQKYIHLHFEDSFLWPSLVAPYVGEHGTCRGMKHMCAIVSNGDVIPCCLDSKGDCVLGNIYEQSFEDILRQPRVHAMVHGFSQNRVVEELCQHCSYRLRFST